MVLTGAGMSAESGLATFRDSGGLWEGQDVMEVASPEGWTSDPELVLRFYNERRRQALSAKPNRGHQIVAQLEKYFQTTVITQNVDDLHERAGSKKVIHLHGSLFESRSTIDPSRIYPQTGDINIGDVCELNSQLRPNIVWFGESVPMIEVSAEIVTGADIFVVIGTSLVVYPAAGLINYVGKSIPKYIIDVNIPDVGFIPKLMKIEASAGEGAKKLFDLLVD